ncbi:MAG: hypothetical protein EHM28_15085, partial [Spirochaetaceae bacterium]
MKKTLHYCFYILIFALLASTYAFAEPVRIVVIDFELQSDDPGFKNAGKGLAEILSTELSRSSKLAVLERAARNRVFKDFSAGVSENT